MSFKEIIIKSRRNYLSSLGYLKDDVFDFGEADNHSLRVHWLIATGLFEKIFMEYDMESFDGLEERLYFLVREDSDNNPKNPPPWEQDPDKYVEAILEIKRKYDGI